MTRIWTGSCLAIASAALISLAGCTDEKEAAATPPPAVASAAPPPATTSSILPGSAEDFRVNVGDTVHFDYDKYDIRDEDHPLLQHQAAWLARYPAVRVTVEGHCDDRGTREYNLALGARRSNSVKEYLVSLGVSSARVDTISYGKERPVCTDESESCWSQNRRGVTTISAGASS